jgi:FAD-dependent urate hydroxylase
MNDSVDVAIVGAGPYGLSLAAHLRSGGVSYRQFGSPMSLWRTAMPRGMYLKSQGFASNLSDPDGTHTLKRYCQESGRTYADYGVPVSLDTFVSYGQWFQAERGLEVEEVFVTEVTRRAGMFELSLSDGERARARNVVIATGVEHFAWVPDVLSHLPTELCSHSGDHDDLAVFAGRDVVVVGAGQSALESAALLHENGASVRLIARASNVVWNGPPLASNRALMRRLREPEAGLGSGWSTWFYSRHPRLFRHLPTRTRVHRARTALGPAGAWWLRDRVEGRFPVHAGHSLKSAQSEGKRVRLGMRTAEGSDRELTADHVISATGYPPDVRRLRFLDARLLSDLITLDRTPAVGRDFQSSVRGLFFVGAAVAPTFGPVMRFVYGADYAVRMVANQFVPSGERKASAVGGAVR